ncbi:hypothetical protein STEG23_000387 [Scotinomys teguina]
MKAAALRCQLLLILLMSAVMLLPGTNGSLLLVQRTVTWTIVLQETIDKGQFGKVLQLLVKLFETEHLQLDVMEQLELKKTLLDRMVHLLSRGYVLPVVSYILKCLEKLDTDISLIRCFVTEVLDVIAPPYTSDFVQLFLPTLENDGIAGTIKAEGEHDPV